MRHTSAVSYGPEKHRDPRVSWEVSRWVIGMVLAAATAYFTTTNAIEVKLATVKATEDSHFQEILRQFTEIREDIRDLRSDTRDQAPAPRSSQIWVPPNSTFGGK